MDSPEMKIAMQAATDIDSNDSSESGRIVLAITYLAATIALSTKIVCKALTEAGSIE